ncbi:MAG TPA: ornithine cyclodeaminase family protein [Longimicrobiales bacterium]|nr:ornithine cyclodeaminase family protein [Longimicrobiales bacterium]
MRILSRAQVREAIGMPTAIEVMRFAFAALSRGKATVPMRLALESQAGVTLLMPAHLHESESSGLKVVSVYPGNPGLGVPVIQAVILVLDGATGAVRAMMDGTWLTALRTGAAAGLATDLLARADSSTVALFGAGVQARMQLEAVRCVRPVTDVRVVSRSGASAEALVAELEGVSARRVERPEDALLGADIVITATNSTTPVFDGSLVEPGAHVTAIGSFTPDMREVDTALVLRARVVVDQRDAALSEAGDIMGPIRDGAVDASVVSAELGDIVLGRAPGRLEHDEITLFKSVGNAVQDVAIAVHVLAVAEERGLGQTVEV